MPLSSSIRAPKLAAASSVLPDPVKGQLPSEREALSVAISGSTSKTEHIKSAQTKSFATSASISKHYFPFAEALEGREKHSKPQAGSEVQSCANKRVLLI